MHSALVENCVRRQHERLRRFAREAGEVRDMTRPAIGGAVLLRHLWKNNPRTYVYDSHEKAGLSLTF